MHCALCIAHLMLGAVSYCVLRIACTTPQNTQSALLPSLGRVTYCVFTYLRICVLRIAYCVLRSGADGVIFSNMHHTHAILAYGLTS